MSSELTATWIVRNESGNVGVISLLYAEPENLKGRGKIISNNSVIPFNKNVKKKLSFGSLWIGEDTGLLEIAMAT